VETTSAPAVDMALLARMEFHILKDIGINLADAYGAMSVLTPLSAISTTTQ